MRFKKVIFLLCLATSSNVFAENVTDAFSKCAVTDNDKQRLACYDKIRDDIVKKYSGEKGQPSKYLTIDLSDLKVDMEKLNGKRVSVSADVQSFAGSYFLKADMMDSNPVILNVTKLPREDRKKIMNECQTMMCSGVFYGVVKDSEYEHTFVLEKVDWR